MLILTRLNTSMSKLLNNYYYADVSYVEIVLCFAVNPRGRKMIYDVITASVRSREHHVTQRAQYVHLHSFIYKCALACMKAARQIYVGGLSSSILARSSSAFSASITTRSNAMHVEHVRVIMAFRWNIEFVRWLIINDRYLLVYAVTGLPTTKHAPKVRLRQCFAMRSNVSCCSVECEIFYLTMLIHACQQIIGRLYSKPTVWWRHSVPYWRMDRSCF